MEIIYDKIFSIVYFKVDHYWGNNIMLKKPTAPFYTDSFLEKKSI